MSHRIRRIAMLLAAAMTFSACNLPSGNPAPATEDPNAVFTAAAQTVEACEK